MVENLGETQKKILGRMSDLCWLKPRDKTTSSAMARLYARGLVTRRAVKELFMPLHYEYQLSDKGLDVVLNTQGANS